jgi:hypothetical protein
MSTHSKEVASERPTLESVKKTHVPKMSPIRARIAHLAIAHGLISDVGKIINKDENDELTRNTITGAHEENHARGFRTIGAIVRSLRVNKDGSGATTASINSFVRNVHELRILVRGLMYAGHMGHIAERKLGLTPHGHGFDMAQNEGLADQFQKVTGESGSALNSEAERWASSDTQGQGDSLLLAGIRHGLMAT